jgi:Uma2 family endonuclease
MGLISPQVPTTLNSGPAWEIATLFPDQGDWDEADYLALNQMTNRFVELADGRIEVLEMPGKPHQKRGRRLADAIDEFCRRRRIEGETILPPYPVRVGRGRFREPDVVFSLDAERNGDAFATKPDLVAEVVSQDRDRDLVKKRREYAAAGIPEYWIIDSERARIIVLTLRGTKYVVHGEYEAGSRAESKILKGFSIDASDLLA